MTELDPFLLSTDSVDSDHPEVQAFARRHASAESPVASAVALYYAVRDGFRYSPWAISLRREHYRASDVLSRTYERGGHCIDKSLLLAAGARVLGIPSRLHYANVRNHLGTAKLEEKLGSDVLVFHGYTELFLEGQWVAATPAFNRQLCEHLRVAPLEFDGRSDSIFQDHSGDGRRFMEYVHDYGSFADHPFELMLAEWKRHYPAMTQGTWPPPEGAR